MRKPVVCCLSPKMFLCCAAYLHSRWMEQTDTGGKPPNLSFPPLWGPP
jgi:hypothetical protein